MYVFFYLIQELENIEKFFLNVFVLSFFVWHCEK